MREVIIYDEYDDKLKATFKSTDAYEAVRNELIRQLQTRYAELRKDRLDNRSFPCVVAYASGNKQYVVLLCR